MTRTVQLNIPADLTGWNAAMERAKDIYWQCRRDGCDENDALRRTLDDALRDTVAKR